MLQRIGRYEVLELIAAGGQGSVYRGRDTDSGDVVALKVMHPGHTGEVEYLEALKREANLASRLDHPNIVKVFDFQVEDGTAYVAMEYVPRVLRTEMQAGTPLTPRRATEVASQVLSASAHAHQHGVVHRDIKPQNILITEDGSVKVTDPETASNLACWQRNAMSAPESPSALGANSRVLTKRLRGAIVRRTSTPQPECGCIRRCQPKY
jgi:serine/threonine protein kinase